MEHESQRKDDNDKLEIYPSISTLSDVLTTPTSAAPAPAVTPQVAPGSPATSLQSQTSPHIGSHLLQACLAKLTHAYFQKPKIEKFIKDIAKSQVGLRAHDHERFLEIWNDFAQKEELIYKNYQEPDVMDKWTKKWGEPLPTMHSEPCR